MTERHYQAVRSSYTDLDDWGRRLAAPYYPGAGSELDVDDTDWAPLPFSQVVVSSMAASRDHLHAVRVLLDAGQVFPFAHASLVRTALLSAAQAVWLLAPDDAFDRTERARTLTAHIYHQHLAYLRDLRARANTPHPDTAAVQQHVTDRSALLIEKRKASGQAASFNATQVIESAALAIWGTPTSAVEARAEWRSGSGAAHGLLWPLYGRPSTQAGAADADGMTEFRAGGSVDDFANAYFAAYRLLRHAFDFLDRRGATSG